MAGTITAIGLVARVYGQPIELKLRGDYARAIKTWKYRESFVKRHMLDIFLDKPDGGKLTNESAIKSIANNRGIATLYCDAESQLQAAIKFSDMRLDEPCNEARVYVPSLDFSILPLEGGGNAVTVSGRWKFVSGESFRVDMKLAAYVLEYDKSCLSNSGKVDGITQPHTMEEAVSELNRAKESLLKMGGKIKLPNECKSSGNYGQIEGYVLSDSRSHEFSRDDERNAAELSEAYGKDIDAELFCFPILDLVHIGIGSEKISPVDVQNSRLLTSEWLDILVLEYEKNGSKHEVFLRNIRQNPGSISDCDLIGIMGGINLSDPESEKASRFRESVTSYFSDLKEKTERARYIFIGACAAAVAGLGISFFLLRKLIRKIRKDLKKRREALERDRREFEAQQRRREEARLITLRIKREDEQKRLEERFLAFCTSCEKQARMLVDEVAEYISVNYGRHCQKDPKKEKDDMKVHIARTTEEALFKNPGLFGFYDKSTSLLIIDLEKIRGKFKESDWHACFHNVLVRQALNHFGGCEDARLGWLNTGTRGLLFRRFMMSSQGSVQFEPLARNRYIAAALHLADITGENALCASFFSRTFKPVEDRLKRLGFDDRDIEKLLDIGAGCNSSVEAHIAFTRYLHRMKKKARTEIEYKTEGEGIILGEDMEKKTEFEKDVEFYRAKLNELEKLYENAKTEKEVLEVVKYDTSLLDEIHKKYPNRELHDTLKREIHDGRYWMNKAMARVTGETHWLAER